MTLDLSFPPDSCINKGIVKEEPVCLKYPSVDDLVQLIKTKGIVKEERYA